MKVLFLFHMHQPPYKLGDNPPHYPMPWVFTHLIREYYDVARSLMEVETPAVTINFSGSLIEQIEDYASGNFTDEFIERFKMDPRELSKEDKIFILRNFFSVNYEHRIKPFKKYLELYVKRGTPSNLEEKVERFEEQEWRDIQVFFFLSQISLYYQREDETIKELIPKGRGFTEEDKSKLLEKCFEIASRVLPLYKELKEKGLEISFTPMYHPILPLIIDSSEAKNSNPGCVLPDQHFSSEEDALEQIKRGRQKVSSVFGEIAGSWPAEGSVSDRAIRIYSQADVKWIATDEEILNRTIGKFRESEFYGGDHLYRPYKLGGVNVFFRDHILSDLIGFVYNHWDIEKAVDDFITRLGKIEERNPNAIVSIILDGENPWEYYPDGGTEFLPRLLGEISKRIELTTFSKAEAERELEHIHPGSWINADFSTWICDQEKNTGWTYLSRVKSLIYQKVKENPRAYRAWLMAEASDWFWWLGEGHPSFYAPEFDRIFREHLKNAFRYIGVEPPEFLDIPIKSRAEMGEIIAPMTYCTPILDGRVTNYYEWRLSGIIKPGFTTMTAAESPIEEIRYIFDDKNLYLLLSIAKMRAQEFLLKGFDILVEVREDDHGAKFIISENPRVERPEHAEIKISCGKIPDSIGFCARSKLEIAIPRNLIGNTETPALRIQVLRDGNPLFSYPQEGFFILKRTEYDPDAVYW